jgi:TetR/AcrR family transcriptional regulator, transcriptional repressor for nem operon
MKVTREQAEENHRRVIDVASRLYRENGFDGANVADIMKGAGLTHGGFYAQFKSKDDLAAKASVRGFAQTLEKVRERARASRGDPLATLIKSYVSRTHRDARGTGCMIAALASEVGRQKRPLRAVFASGIEEFIDAVADMHPGPSKTAKRKKAMATLAEMVGAVVLARAVDDALAQEIIDATVADLTSPR